jgi:hypothetical protein
MTKAEGLEVHRLRLAAEAQQPQTALAESPALIPSIYQPREEAIPPVKSIVAQVRHFRAPPATL